MQSNVTVCAPSDGLREQLTDTAVAAHCDVTAVPSSLTTTDAGSTDSLSSSSAATVTGLPPSNSPASGSATVITGFSVSDGSLLTVTVTLSDEQ